MDAQRTRLLITGTAALLWLAVTAYLTLDCVAQVTPVPFWSFFAETMASVDYVQNVVLFLPLGWIARRGRWSVWQAVLAGALISASIEFSQQWIPGRTSQASDIICNTAGVALGCWMAVRAESDVASRGGFLPVLVRLPVALLAFGGFMSLHVLNTMWATAPARADGAGVWTSVTRVKCADGTRASTLCIEVPNTSKGGSKYVRVVGIDERTYARVQSNATGRMLTRRDCVLISFESTIGARMRLRPPLEAACGVTDTTATTIALQVNARLEHESRGEWTPTRAGVWLWPVWPFSAYQPLMLVAAGALAFVVLASLMAGAASWVIPAGYLAVLEIVALIAGMRTPGWWELLWTAVGWVAAAGIVRADRAWCAPPSVPEA